MKFITNLQDVADFTVSAERKLFSATHEEIVAGLTQYTSSRRGKF